MNDKKPIPDAPANEEPRDFIRDMVQADLASGRVQGIVTRFPPEPNGYLHVGHAKSICLNFGLARDYGGVCHLRFDDTNPEKEEQEYVDAIIDAVHWLGFGWEGPDPADTQSTRSHLYFASDYFDVMYRAAEALIGAGLAYVDEQTAEQMRATRVGSAGRDGFVFDPNAGERLCIVEGSAWVDDIDLATAATQSNIATDVDENAVGAGCFARLLDRAVDDVGLAESVNVDRTAGTFGAKRESAPGSSFPEIVGRKNTGQCA